MPLCPSDLLPLRRCAKFAPTAVFLAKKEKRTKLPSVFLASFMVEFKKEQ